MRRVLAAARFADWLRAFLPQIPRDGRRAWLAPGVVTDRCRSEARPPRRPEPQPRLDARRDRRRPARRRPRASRALRAAAAAHREAGLVGVTGEHYEGGHWLGTFAVYLLTGRGLGAPP